MSEMQGYTPGRIVQGTVVEPTAVIDPMSEAVHGVVVTLKSLMKNAVGAFHSEKDLDAANEALDKWERAHVSASQLQALLAEHDGPAAKEDVRLRVPSQPGLPQSAAGAPIDYNKLAAAIAAHMQAQVIQPPASGGGDVTS
jgi:hypothetical protein